MLARFFSRRWLLATALVLAAAAVMARLGVWQLDRLEWRRSLNERITTQQMADALTLDETAINLDLYSMEYRRVTVTGTYLPNDEIVLRNQVWSGEFGSQHGVKLFTPMLIANTQSAILIERGWIPQEDAADRSSYFEEGVVSVSGQLRRAETDFNLSQSLHPDPTLSPGEARLDAWNSLDLERLSAQVDVELLPVYIQRIPSGAQAGPPFATTPELDLSEGSHFGYALQWFAFALVLLVGYPVYVFRREGKLNAA